MMANVTAEFPTKGATVEVVTLRYWASARAAAGVSRDEIETSTELTLAELIAASVRLHPDSPRLAEILDCCSILLGDQPVGAADRASVRVRSGSVVEFLPPFAGG